MVVGKGDGGWLQRIICQEEQRGRTQEGDPDSRHSHSFSALRTRVPRVTLCLSFFALSQTTRHTHQRYGSAPIDALVRMKVCQVSVFWRTRCSSAVRLGCSGAVRPLSA